MISFALLFYLFRNPFTLHMTQRMPEWLITLLFLFSPILHSLRDTLTPTGTVFATSVPILEKISFSWKVLHTSWTVLQRNTLIIPYFSKLGEPELPRWSQ